MTPKQFQEWSRTYSKTIKLRFDRVERALLRTFPPLPPAEDVLRDHAALRELADAYYNLQNLHYMAHERLKQRSTPVCGWKRSIIGGRTREALCLIAAAGTNLRVDVSPLVSLAATSDYPHLCEPQASVREVIELIVTTAAVKHLSEKITTLKVTKKDIEPAGASGIIGQVDMRAEGSTRPGPDPGVTSDEARNFEHCLTWCESHWLTAIDYEQSRMRATNGGQLQHDAQRSESYEKQRDESWRSARKSGFYLLGSAEAWNIPCTELRKLLNSLHHSYLPCVCGVGMAAPHPPDFGPALAISKLVGLEAETRLALGGGRKEWRDISEGYLEVAPLMDPAEIRDSARPQQQAESSDAEPSHSADFTTVNWYGTPHIFDDGLQSKAVECLWGEWKKGGHGISEKTIGVTIGSASNNYRLVSTFRNHPAWNTMIVKVAPGIYRLKRPE